MKPSGRGVGVLVLPEADAGALSAVQREESFSWVADVEARLAAWKARLIAAEKHDCGAEQAARMVRDKLGASGRQARGEVEVSEHLAELPEVTQALECGEIPPGHALLIARAAAEGPIDAAVLVAAARYETYDQLVRTVRRHQQDMSDDDGQELLDRQHEKRSARAFTSRDNGMFVFSGEFDPITGNRIALVLSDKERELWRKEDPKCRRTPQQRMADALAELILEPKSGQPPRTTLLVIADYDVINQQLTNARLSDGTPLPVKELLRLACDADIMPGVFRAKTQRLWLGRKRRTASEAQRAALALRDQGCIGCAANPAWCQAHHIKPWKDGGPTYFNNLVLVCARCHHNIHDDGWEVHPTSCGGYELQPPPDPFPDAGVDTYRPPQHNPLLLK